jgi:hypothetical protein
MKNLSPLIWLIILLIFVVILSTLGPSEATLGSNARIVYLHGVWVWVSLIAFLGAGISGVFGIFKKLKGMPSSIHQWSRALGRTGLLFWITYLPLSLWAMESNWNGLFLAEPRWRLAVIFAIGGTLLQIGLSFLPAWWSSFWNIIYILALSIGVGITENVLHPANPIFNSNAWRIQLFFIGLLLLVLAAAWQVVRFFFSLETYKKQ